MKNALGQFVGFVKKKQRCLHLNKVVNDPVEQFSDAVAFCTLTDAACNLPYKVTLLHVFRTQDVEHLVVLRSIEARRGCLSTACFSHYPCDILHSLGIFHDEGHFLKGFRFNHLPVCSCRCA